MAWKMLLRHTPETVTLHYPSYTAPLWADFSVPLVRHHAHSGWKTWDNRDYRYYDDSAKDFDFEAIPRGSRVVLDSSEGMRQLMVGLLDRGCSVVLHVVTPEHILHKNLERAVRDLARFRRMSKFIYISRFVRDKLQGDIFGRALLNHVPGVVVYLGVRQADDLVLGADPVSAFYFGRYEKYKIPYFSKSLIVRHGT